MITRLTGGRLFDPTQGMNGTVGDLYIRDSHFIPAPANKAQRVLSAVTVLMINALCGRR
ncbi:MAG: hypothetical protein ABW104_17935 [Candidatus Thiodiazotropha sp. 6PLUC2]